ncbi:MAG: Gfo/Idh/MocA family oxidoreductase [Planctomycetota bacterium]|nr:Gfo/Idh/MocA family oxidoreductase [Planctomycetota bacterium]
MRIGIMGVHYGHIGGMFHSAVNAPDGEIVGLVEPDDALYERYTKELDIPRFDSLKKMLDTAKPELVLEGVVHREKVDTIEKCAAAGANVLLDKPLCYDLDDLERIRCAVKESGIALSMWFTSRSYPPFLAVREAILAGELGEIVSIISTHPHKTNRKTGTSWYFDSSQYTGTFHDVACHGVDQVRWLTGAECIGVHALQACKKFTEEPRLIDHTQASFQMSDGSLATLTADWLTPDQSPSFGDTRVIIMGTEGSAHLRAYASNHVLIVSNAKGAYEPDFPEDRGGVFVQELIEAIREGHDSFISTRDVLAVSKACLMAQKSAKRGGEFLMISE